MLAVWRLVREHHANEPLFGEGARRYGGRWNDVGVSVIYTSEHRSLAALEVLVHLNGTNPNSPYQLLSYEVDEAMIHYLPEAELPPDWRQEPPPFSTVQWGTQWARENRSVALAVPSTVVPEEQNIVLNTNHRDIRKIKTGKSTPFVFDPRLFTSR